MIKNKDLKRRIIEISYKLKIGHIGSCLTAVDIIEEIYQQMKPDEKFVLSAGHAHLAHLVVKEKRSNQFPVYDIEGIIKQYGIHCDREAGCDVSTGSLGHGIGIAVGMALADRTKNVYCLVSDGELAEGSVHEAVRIWHEQRLMNLNIYVNFNGWGAYKKIDDLYQLFRFTDMDKPMFIDVRETYHEMWNYPKWLQGQIAHYKVLNKQEYNELIKLLK